MNKLLESVELSDWAAHHLQPEDAANMAIVKADADVWYVLGSGTSCSEGLFCHLASATRSTQQKNGCMPVQSNRLIPWSVLAECNPSDELAPTSEVLQ